MHQENIITFGFKFSRSASTESLVKYLKVFDKFVRVVSQRSIVYDTSTTLQ